MHTEIPTIPGYDIAPDGKLGEGGFAAVYLARHKGLHIDVALKIMDTKMADDADFSKRFLREGRMQAALGNHSSIVNIYDLGCIDENYYIAMQYLPGPNLREVLDSGRPYNHPLELMRPIVDAVGYAHTRGFVHRDIKPANILFDEDGRAVLSDFGIAKSVDQNTQLTSAGVAIGTAAYMSPEQAKGLRDIDGRSDLYSIGVVLYEMLSGEQPYQATDQMGLMLQHVNDPIPQLPDSEKIFQPLISNLMAKEPNERYPDANAVLADIDALLAGNKTKKIGRARPSMSMPPVKVNKKTGAISAAVVALLLLGGVVYKFIGGSPGGTTEAPDESFVAEQETEPVVSDSPEVTRLLILAQQKETFGELIAPPGSNALELYQAVLKLNPNHPRASQRVAELEEMKRNQ